METPPLLNLKQGILLLKPILSELGLAQVVKAPEFQQSEACVGTLKAYKVIAISWNIIYDTQLLKYIWANIKSFLIRSCSSLKAKLVAAFSNHN